MRIVITVVLFQRSAGRTVDDRSVVKIEAAAAGTVHAQNQAAVGYDDGGIHQRIVRAGAFIGHESINLVKDEDAFVTTGYGDVVIDAVQCGVFGQTQWDVEVDLYVRDVVVHIVFAARDSQQ